MSMLGVAVAGLAVLVVLAVIIGKVDAHSRDRAWKRVAAARKDDVWFREQQLTKCLDEPVCYACPMRWYLRDQHGE